MAKRKAKARKPAKKLKVKLETNFNCLNCLAVKSVTVKINATENTALLTCKNCSTHYSTNSNSLTEPIDVYAEWVDEYDANPHLRTDGSAHPSTNERPNPADEYEEDEEDDDDE